MSSAWQCLHFRHFQPHRLSSCRTSKENQFESTISSLRMLSTSCLAYYLCLFLVVSFQTSFPMSLLQKTTYQPSRTSARKSTKLPGAKLSIGKLLKLIPDRARQMLEVTNREKTQGHNNLKNQTSPKSLFKVSAFFGHNNKIQDFIGRFIEPRF